MMHQAGFYEKYVKRALDIVLSGLALLLLWPFMLIIALFVRIMLGSPVIFSQERPGLHEKIFRLYKFRSMTDERDSETGLLLSDEKRLTRFGRFLRTTSMDELPELWNIFRGDMSLVGPRPLLVEYLPYYTEEERLRHEVRPGFTGLAQINGRNTISWEQKFAYDIDYVCRRISFREDIRILWRTVFKVIKRADILSGDELKKVAGRLDDERRKAEFRNHISLRRFERSDVPIKVKWINDSRNNKYLHYHLPLILEDTYAWFDRIVQNRGRLDLVICYDNRPVGIIGLLNICDSDAELYITIGEQEFKGRGLCEIAMEKLCRKAFSEYQIKSIYLLAETENKAAIHAYEKFGMENEKRLINDIANQEGVMVDRYLFRISKEAFGGRYGTESDFSNILPGNSAE